MYKAKLKRVIRYQFIAATGLCTAAVFKDALPIMIPHRIRRHYQFYQRESGQPVEVSDELLGLLDSVLQEVEMPEEKAKKVDVYTAKSQPEYFGNLYGRAQCLMGVPFSFNYKSVQDLYHDKDVLINKRFPWEDPRSEKLLENLLLTDDEKKFVLARQLGYLDSFQMYARVALKILYCGITLATAAILGDITSVHQEALRSGRAFPVVFIFLLSAAFCCLLYLALCDLHSSSLDQYADKYSAAINSQIAQAGLTYYSKVMEVNKILRELDPMLKKEYTVYGNESLGWGMRFKLTLSNRKALLAKYIEKQQNKDQQETAL